MPVSYTHLDVYKRQDISSVQQAETQVAEATSIADTLLNIIPKNPIQGLAEGNMLQIILFALIAVSYTHLKRNR